MPSVREVMSKDLVTVDRSATVEEASTVMWGRRVGSALVMRGDDLEGIFTERDIMKALS
jgi:CBS domain-containing protein